MELEIGEGSSESGPLANEERSRREEIFVRGQIHAVPTLVLMHGLAHSEMLKFSLVINVVILAMEELDSCYSSHTALKRLINQVSIVSGMGASHRIVESSMTSTIIRDEEHVHSKQGHNQGKIVR